MLVLSRRPDEKIVFPGIGTSIQIVALKQGAVRLGIDAPPDVVVVREELLEPGAAAAAPTLLAAAVQLQQLQQSLHTRLGSLTVGLALLRGQAEAGDSAGALATLARLEREVRALQDQALAPGAAAAVPLSAGRRKALLVEDDVNECEESIA